MDSWSHRIDSCRRNQAVVRSGRGCSGTRRGGGRGREGTVAPHGAFPAMQSLKGEPRHYAMAVVHGPLPHHPFDSSFPHCFSFPSSNFLIAFSLSLPSCPTSSCFSYFIGEKASPPYIPTPTAYGTLRFGADPMTHDSTCDNPMHHRRVPCYRPLLVPITLPVNPT